MGDAPTIVLVGHCVPDQFMLKNMLRRAAPDASVVVANAPADLMPFTSGAVLLINRILDGAFPNDSGLDLLRAHTVQDGASPALLISNLPDAQAEAEAAGALPGFGKSDLESAETAECITTALQRAAAS